MLLQLVLRAAVSVSLVVIATDAWAQECACDHEVTPETLTINGVDMGVQAGETICVQGGSRPFLRVYDMVGTAEAPIVIKNCGGQVVIDNSDRGYGLTLDGSSFVRITGTGDEAHLYGFRVRASRAGPDYSASCIVAAGMSTDYEIDHIEAFECGFAGVSAKTDPSCDARDLSGFVQRNSRLHHLYLHDTGGEGIYFGSTGFPSRTRRCDGVDVELIPHTHEGVWIHDNIIEDTGWDGAQVGVSPRDCFVYRNRISRVGLEMEQDQMQGLQIGGGSRCQIFDNFLSNGSANGIIVLDAADTSIENNVIVDFETSIYINDRDSEVTEGAQYRVVHNTVVGASRRGVTLFGSRSAGNVVANNLIVAAGDSPLGIGADVDASDEANLILASGDEALFVDAAGHDYQLTKLSPAVDYGVGPQTSGVEIDQLGAMRDDKPDAGAFEFGATPPDEPTSPPEPGQGPGQPGGEPGEEPGDDGDGDPEGMGGASGGCSYRDIPPGHGPEGRWLLAAAVAALLLLRRRSGRAGVGERAP